jgi:hypothetical protein
MTNRTRSGDSLCIAVETLRAVLLLLVLATLAASSACHSYHVDATVENRAGEPSAVFHYRIQLRGNGPLKLQYTASNKRQVQVDGPAMAEPQEGAMQIVLLPGGKAEFHLHLTKVP